MRLTASPQAKASLQHFGFQQIIGSLAHQLSSGDSIFQVDLFFGSTQNVFGYRSEFWDQKMRSTRLPSVLGSRYAPLLVVQTAANLLLAVWLYLEYTHNPFMQTYVSNVWATIWPEVTISVSVAIVAVVILAFYESRRSEPLAARIGSKSRLEDIEGSNNLAKLDVCPFCETPLRPISEGRLQCRKCRRYFKSSLPKIEM